jgi:hypothetical protein
MKASLSSLAAFVALAFSASSFSLSAFFSAD